MAAVEEFEWPWQYNFPPFFTLQPNSDTRSKQLSAWCSLILSFYRHTKTFSIDITEAQSSSLFNNKSIDRRLSIDNIRKVLGELEKQGHVEWKNPEKTQCLVMWRTPAQWGKLIYSWINSQAMTNTVCTLYELANGDESSDQEFHGIEDWLLLRALKSLESDRKAELIFIDEDNQGVKFF